MMLAMVEESDAAVKGGEGQGINLDVGWESWGSQEFLDATSTVINTQIIHNGTKCTKAVFYYKSFHLLTICELLSLHLPFQEVVLWCRNG